MEYNNLIYKVGMIITHPNKPEWGPGEVVNVTDTTVHIFFRGVRKTIAFMRICPLGPIGWDSTLEGWDSPYLDFDEAKIEADVNYFAKPDWIYSPKDLRKKGLTPRCAGVYGWYFDEPPPYVPTMGCTDIKTGWWPFRTKWWLLYIGQAENLRERIVKYHIKGEHYAKGTMSSLRLSLGCLLSKRLDLILCYPPESFGDKDEKLDKWLEKHTRVTWVRPENIGIVEKKAIAKYVLPLNHRDNEHLLVRPLSDLRTAFKNIAKDPVRKSKKKYFRRTYKEFAKQCKVLGIEK